MKFTSAYASASICTPTRAALMTGKYPARLNMTIWHEQAKTPQQNKKLIPPIVEGSLSHDEVTIAEVLRTAGYKTGHVGKWHLGEASHYPETHGFDFTFGGCCWGCVCAGGCGVGVSGCGGGGGRVFGFLAACVIAFRRITTTFRTRDHMTIGR